MASIPVHKDMAVRSRKRARDDVDPSSYSPSRVSPPASSVLSATYSTSPSYFPAFADYGTNGTTSVSLLPPSQYEVWQGPPPAQYDQYDHVFPLRLPPRQAESDLPNPFEDHVDTRQLKGGQFSVSVQTGVNGYVKFQSRRPIIVGPRDGDHAFAQRSAPSWVSLYSLPEVWYANLGNVDRRFFQFYIAAWCAGRTVLKRTNCWLQDIAQMAHKDDCVKHAIFALAGTYMVDFFPDEKLQKAAQEHYKRAVVLLSLLLANARHDVPSDRDAEALVAAIALLNMADAVAQEHWREKSLTPRWLDGARLACRVLDMTNPCRRYEDNDNIQPSDARVGNTIIASRPAILALTMTPLHAVDMTQKFEWLLQGSELSKSRIHGGCGMSPALLHHFFLITQMAAFQRSDPVDSEMVTEPLAFRTRDELKQLCQWYEHENEHDPDSVTRVSIDVRTIRKLLDSDHLDAHGAINSKPGMTASAAEAWRLAAIIYLQCRVLRLPRTHPEVLQQASSLAARIRVMPTSGVFFTAQAPFFPVFLLGVVAVEEEHVKCALDWFTKVTAAGCRSSVPPAFDALKKIRRWMLTGVKDVPLPLEERLRNRYAWWEDVVDYASKDIGTLCLV
ncbi:hypothetical protein CSOJ01_04385 [Colletotrichum sojae]|uniref:Uncharacterized protein n=1 Tax=Colletotrichum sojae TaxID=2175907 RepID=A0A8H6JIU1_9PEZI|nr:hypothetical protein CSOJ01_04385 [Colletotrichum sojae]